MPAEHPLTPPHAASPSVILSLPSRFERNPYARQWCAGSAIKRPCQPVPVTYAPGAHGPDARR